MERPGTEPAKPSEADEPAETTQEGNQEGGVPGPGNGEKAAESDREEKSGDR